MSTCRDQRKPDGRPRRANDRLLSIRRALLLTACLCSIGAGASPFDEYKDRGYPADDPIFDDSDPYIHYLAMTHEDRSKAEAYLRKRFDGLPLEVRAAPYGQIHAELIVDGRNVASILKDLTWGQYFLSVTPLIAGVLTTDEKEFFSIYKIRWNVSGEKLE